ncbi:MAG TPA: hypothetical protein VMZ05_03895 [Spirochaetota bacterium]|nr:hypothetical protein [Spirochaetota bacterium]
MRGIRRLACISMSILLPGILILFTTGCGIYAIDAALMAPYNLTNTTDSLSFYGDDEALLQGYNVWYKEETGYFYKRCYYYNELNTPTIDKEIGATVIYTVDLQDLYPQEDKKSFYEINYNDKLKKFYFAVSAYGTGIAESGKAAFPRWPD